MTPLRIVFMGSPAIALPTLSALVDSSDEVIAVVSQPDRPSGRGHTLTPPAVAVFAKDHKIPLFQPTIVRNNETFLQMLKDLKPDVIVVVAYGKILPTEILTLPKHKCINVHFSLLPAYRGAAPLQWSLINGDEETGVTTFILNEKVDQGEILLQRKAVIREEDNTETLGQRLSIIGAEVLIETLEKLKSGELHPFAQNEKNVTYAPPLKKENGHLDWTRKADQLWGQVRGMNPWPGTFTYLDGKLLKIHRASFLEKAHQAAPGSVTTIGPEGLEIACGHGALVIQELQLEGKKRVSVEEFLRGHPLAIGQRLGDKAAS